MSKIEVGTKVVMELAGMKGRLQALFVGYIHKRCVITTIPTVPEVNRALLLEHLYNGNLMTVRYIHSGIVLGFTAKIIHVSFRPFPLLFLEHPEQIESFQLRKDGRVTCLFPAGVTHKDSYYWGVLTDISISGCNIVLSASEHQDMDIEIDDHLALSCPLLLGIEHPPTTCVVKRFINNGIKVELGLKYLRVPEELLEKIHSYIEQTIVFTDMK